MTKILITGCNGQLGNEIRDIADKTPFSFTYTDVAELDITDINAIDSLFAATPFDYVVNCAAYTNVNKAESEEDIAYKINAVAPENLAKVCAKYNSTFIHVSTDYVFDGNACQPYSESDSVYPQSAYGRTKLAGENLALKACQNTIILRTAWLYSEYGNNFVKTMMRLGTEKDELSVVFDQVGTPTYAGDLAQTILSIIKKIENGEKDFSVSFLYKCAEIFRVDMVEILTGVYPKLSDYCVVRAGKGLPVARRDRFEYHLLAYLFKDKRIEPMLVVAPYIEEEQGKPIKMSSHEGQEWDYILKGKLRVIIDDHEVVLSQGDSVYYDSGKLHGMIALDGEDCEFLAVLIDK